MRTPEVLLSGEGEPLLHPGLCDIASAFKDAGLRVQCFTNGTLIDEAMAERLVRSRLDVLSIAFWAVNPPEHAVWHPGVSADFLERRKRGIELVHRAKRLARQPHPIVNLQMPLNRGNYRNIGERVELALASRCERVTFGVFRDYDGQFESECLSGEDLEVMRPDLLAAREQFERAGITHNIDEYLERIRFGRQAWRACPCYAGWFQSYVKVDGTVFPCCRCKQAVGRLTEHSFIEIWNGPAYRDFRRRSSDPQQLARMGGECSCPNCCFWDDDRRVYRVWRWIAPLVPSRKKAPVR
jgi:MoaA/NifB/PqqE/SkfB family radical SAM enzyme